MNWIKVSKDGASFYINLAGASRIEPHANGSSIDGVVIDQSPEDLLMFTTAYDATRAAEFKARVLAPKPAEADRFLHVPRKDRDGF